MGDGWGNRCGMWGRGMVDTGKTIHAFTTHLADQPAAPPSYLDPVKENIGSGTGMGTLMPTCPTSASWVNFLAVAPFVVKMAVPLP